MAGENEQETQEELQRVVSELRGAQQNVERLQNQINLLEDSIEEVEATIETIEGVKEFESGSRILVPIGAGSYIVAEVQNPDKILTDLGAELVAERKPDEAIESHEKQKTDLQTSLENTKDRLEELNEKIEDLRPKAQQLMGQSQAEREELQE